MPLSPQERARRRVVNQAQHRAAKRAAARTPMDRAAAAWDHWRALVGELPEDQRAQWADAITTALDAHITQLTKIFNSDAAGGSK